MKLLILADSHGRDMVELFDKLFPDILTRDITIPGGNLPDLRQSLEHRLPYFKSWNPSHIIIHAGHNAIAPHPSNNMTTIFLTDLVKMIKEMIKQIEDWFPESKVCFSGLFPRTPNSRFSETLTRAYNSKLLRIGRYLTKAKLNFIFAGRLWFKMRPCTPRYEMYYWDGLHLSHKGKEAVAKIWAEYLYSLETSE